MLEVSQQPESHRFSAMYRTSGGMYPANSATTFRRMGHDRCFMAGISHIIAVQHLDVSLSQQCPRKHEESFYERFILRWVLFWVYCCTAAMVSQPDAYRTPEALT